MLLFEDVVAALGRVTEYDLGLQTIALESIVGTVDRRSGEFDRQFRPGSRRLQSRWQKIAAARRRGETMPPIDVYRIRASCTSSRTPISSFLWRALTAPQRSKRASGKYGRRYARPIG
jgi:hypothetical protein